MKKLKRHVRGLVFVLMFGILCTSNFLVNAKSETVSFYKFDPARMGAGVVRHNGLGPASIMIKGEDISKSIQGSRTLFRNTQPLITDKADDYFEYFQIYSNPAIENEPVISIQGYKDCKIKFSLSFYLNGSAITSSGVTVKNGYSLEISKDIDYTKRLSSFYFYPKPDWNSYSSCKATIVDASQSVSKMQDTSYTYSLTVEYEFVIPSDSFDIYGFTTRNVFQVDEHYSNDSINQCWYSLSTYISDFTLDSNDAFVAPDVSGSEASEDMAEIDTITKDFNDQLDIQVDNIRVQWANLWDADFMAGFYVIKEFLDFFFDTKPWNYLVVFSLVLGCTCVALKIAPGIISKTRDASDAARSKKGSD